MRTNKVDERNSSKCSFEFSYIFASRLKKARECKKLTQEEVAGELEISVRTYQHYESLSETNVRVPNFEIVSKLAKILDCDITYLTGENDKDVYEKDLESAAKEIGLKYTSAEKIKNYSHETKDLLDRMITHLDGDNLLKLLQSIYIYSLEAHHSNVQLDVIGADHFQTNETNTKLIAYTNTPGNTLPDISKRMLKYAVTSALDEILTDTYNDYIEDGNALLKKRLNKKAESEKKRCSFLLELRSCGRELSLDELNFLKDNDWNDTFPTELEIYKRIDEKYNELYDLYKE